MNLSWKKRFGVVAGNALEYYDIAVFAAISPFLIGMLSNNGYEEAGILVWGIFALRFLLRPLGGFVIGRVADSKGKKTALIITSSLTGASTLLMGLLPAHSDHLVLYLLALQMIQAFSFGGEFPTIINYLINHSSPKEHSRTGSLVVMSSIMGVILSLLIVSGLQIVLSREEMQTFGWRIPLLIGAVNFAVSFWFRFRLPNETKKFVRQSSRGAMLWMRLFAISVTGGSVFYIQNLSSSIIQKATSIPHFSLLNSTFLLVLVGIAGYATDKMSTSKQSFRMGCLAGCVGYFPLYWLLTHTPLAISLLAMVSISLVSAFILTNLASVLADIARDQTVQLGVSYNVALSIFGGLTPLVIELATSYSTSLIGLYAALCALPGLLATYFLYKVPSPVPKSA